MVIFHSYVGLPEGMAGKEDGTMAAGFSSHGFPVFLGGSGPSTTCQMWKIHLRLIRYYKNCYTLWLFNIAMV